MLAHEPSVARAVRLARAKAPSIDLAAPAAARPVLAATLGVQSRRTLLVVTSTFREAELVTSALGAVLGEDHVCYYPAWETLPHERLSPRADTVGRRLKVLRRLGGTDDQPPPDVVVAPIRSMLQPQVKGLSAIRPVQLRQGQEYDQRALVADLVAAAYSRVDLVERRGEFAVRGGIVDIFPPTEQHPVRVDFFGDEIDEMRYFTVANQRSTDTVLTEVEAAPCRELLLTEQVRSRAASLVDAHPELSEMLEKIAQGHTVEGMEALTPALVDELEMLVDVLPDDTLVIVSDPELVRGRAADLVRTSQEFLHAGWAAAATGGKAPIDLGASAYWEFADVRARALARGMSWWSFSQFAASPDAGHAADDEPSGLPAIELAGVETFTLDLETNPSFKGDANAAVDAMKRDWAAGWRVVLATQGKGIAERMVEVLGDNDVPARVLDELPAGPDPSVVTVVTSDLPHGFRAPQIKLVVHTNADIAGQQVAERSRKMPTKRRNQVAPLELKPGDVLVHEQHGVGKFVEMVQRTVAGHTREYLVLEYAPSKRGHPGDRLYVPMDQLDEVTRYVGGESPSLDRMGGADWKARKSKARKAVREIAAGLIKLYAARRATKGFAFSADTPWQREMEDAFNYTETPDQLSCIEDVKRDMEQIVPMDRLVCGDVGFGKTEIAVRAAFKAVQDGKQVAVLVPTTLLVQQHFETFAERYAGFPVVLRALSRFQSDKEMADTVEGLAAGRVDVVIGTHRLLSDQIKYKDLGLVIIDEEQRFGVEHKEKLKQLRVNVDVLAMSATPIPRTLEMAVTGIREMSTIDTPPEERHPVLTFAGPRDDGQIVAAIRRELAREGQAYYVYNRVRSIDGIAARLQELIPEARIMIAHGQMGEKRLEQVMQDFWERKADVLVCTTIVEAGLDISTANTLIVDGADKMGLSQLHQLRGRVGRGRERGYAYFLYPPDKPLTQTAHDRLAALATNNDLGSGTAIAMKDLEIRGAGNMLGDEQSGHIADVGFDLYIRLVGEAVADYRGEDVEVEQAMRIELPVDAKLPADYVESERLRLEMYKRLAEVRSEHDIAELSAELVDRYGPIPPATQSLIEVARFRLLCRSVGLTEVVTQGRYVRFSPVITDGSAPGAVGAVLRESRQIRLDRLYPGSVRKNAANLVLVPQPTTAPVTGAAVTDLAVLEWASQFVKDIFAD